MDRDYRGRKKKGTAAPAHNRLTMARSDSHDRMDLAALVATFFVHEIVLLLVAGCVSAGVMVLKDLPHPNLPSKRIFSFPFPLLLLTAASSFSLGSLFLFFLKTGAVLFGSGYVLGGLPGAALATIRVNAAWLVLAGGLLGVAFG